MTLTLPLSNNQVYLEVTPLTNKTEVSIEVPIKSEEEKIDTFVIAINKPIKIDPNAKVNKGKVETKKEIQERLNREVEDGMVTVSINPRIEFNTGSSEGLFNIINESSNKYSQKVKIYDDTGTLIYESKIIPVGSEIKKDTLHIKLPKGVHNCKANIKSIDSFNNIIGKVGVEVKIVIAN